MFYDIGYYFLFLFKLFVGIILSLLTFSVCVKEKSEKLKYYSILTVIFTSLVTVANYMQQESSSFVLPFMILFIAVSSLGSLINKQSSKEESLKYFLSFSIAFFVGTGYYLSAVSFVFIVFLISYFLNGIFSFFDNSNDEKFEYTDTENIFNNQDAE